MFLKNKIIIFKIRRSKVTDYAALTCTCEAEALMTGALVIICTFSVWYSLVIMVHMHCIYGGVTDYNLQKSCADPEGDPPPPLKNHKTIGFLSNTGPDPL